MFQPSQIGGAGFLPSTVGVLNMQLFFRLEDMLLSEQQ